MQMSVPMVVISSVPARGAEGCSGAVLCTAMSPGRGPDVGTHLPQAPHTHSLQLWAEPLSRTESKHLHSEAPLYLC